MQQPNDDKSRSDGGRRRVHVWGRGWVVALVIGAVLAATESGALVYVSRMHAAGSPQQLVSSVTPSFAASPVLTATPDPRRPGFETGIAYPSWSTGAYGPSDAAWQAGIVHVADDTGARWVSQVVNLYQDTVQSTTVHAGEGTPTPQALATGIRRAHSLGLKVFIDPLLTVSANGGSWGGFVHFSDQSLAATWFSSYWQAYKPYILVAAGNGAEQLSLGTELEGMESASSALWDQFIDRVTGVYQGMLTYNMNWTTVKSGARDWMRNARLTFIGVSEYQTLTDYPQVLSVPQIQDRWTSRVLPGLDRLSESLGKPILLSEVGYRNARDALFQPFQWTSTSPPDPQLQADAYAAAIQVAFADRHISGIFIWAWENGFFAPSPEAVAALDAQYSELPI